MAGVSSSTAPCGVRWHQVMIATLSLPALTATLQLRFSPPFSPSESW